MLDETLSTMFANEFDRTLSLEPLDDRSFAVELDESWASLVGVHGGYMAAGMTRAAEAVAPGRAVRTATTSFLRPGAVGAARLDVDIVRSGRSFTNIVVSLVQAERLVCSSRITASACATGPEWRAQVTDRPAPIEQCVAFTPPPMIRHFEQARLVIDPTTIPDALADFARVAGHVQPLESRPIDAAWLVMIGDWFPPSPFRRLQPPAGGVSLDYTVHIHRLPSHARPALWLEGVFTAADSSGGIALERGVLSTPDGVAVAETFHTRYTGGR